MKPRIHIIGTGGTIAGVSRAEVSRAGVSRKQTSEELIAYDAAVLSVEALLQSLDAKQLQPLQERFDFTSEQLVNIDSKDMNPQVWWQLVLRLQCSRRSYHAWHGHPGRNEFFHRAAQAKRCV
jgi:L-asparaginase/Glu-tRNA(Gln) amidotransferase subunit D